MPDEFVITIIQLHTQIYLSAWLPRRWLAEAVANLGIAKHKWKKDLDAQGDQAFPGKGDLPALEAARHLEVDAAEDGERPAAINQAVSRESAT